MAKKNYRLYQASGFRRQGQSRPAHRHGAGASGREHYGVLQTVQREDREHGRHQNPGRHHGLRRSLFTFITKTPPAADLLKKAAKIEKGSGKPNREKVGTITRDQIEEIAKTKMPDLNTTNLESAIRTVEGTAKKSGS